MPQTLPDLSYDPPEPTNTDTISTDSGISSCGDDYVVEHTPSSVSLPPPTSVIKFSPVNNKEELVRRTAQNIERVARQKKIFCTGGHFNGARKALKRRGWIEINCHNGRGPGGCVKAASFSGGNPSIAHNQSDAHEYNLKVLKENLESTIKMLSSGNYKKISNFGEHINYRLLKSFIPNYQWCLQRRRIVWKNLRRDQQVNKFPNAYFTTKIGLHYCLQNLHWFSSHPVSSFFPRCYEVSSDEERKAFIEDYRITACFSLIRWFHETFIKKGSEGVEEREGKARRSSIEFALRISNDFISKRTHKDLDSSDSTVWEHQWNQFLTDYYLICHEQDKLQKFYSEMGPSNKDLFEKCEKTFKLLKEHDPQFEMDGYFNMWIIKPGCSSRGRGISIAKRLEKIMDAVGSGSGSNKARYIVQKYIERPLLIYRTKFDIRQWLLVTSWNPLHIWMYKHSYLRFCSQPYNLQSHHESIHLCNNAIQSKYAVNTDRSLQLPAENMWDSVTFHSFLKTQGHGDKWGSVIYPSMRRALIGSLLATQDTMDMSSRNNSFELYGADFMLTEDFNPWLIEINSSPALSSTTAVTARLCSEVLEDVVKVTVDRKKNKNFDSGNFELVYKQNTLQPSFFVGINLTVKGVRIDFNTGNNGGSCAGGGLSHYSGRKNQHYSTSSILKVKENNKNDIRISAPREELRGLLAEAKRSVTLDHSNRKPIITDLIDNIMSIPSCFQDTKSKISLVKEWMEHHQTSICENPMKDKEALPIEKKENDSDEGIEKDVLDVEEEEESSKFSHSVNNLKAPMSFMKRQTSKVCPLSIGDNYENIPGSQFVAPVPKSSRNVRRGSCSKEKKQGIRVGSSSKLRTKVNSSGVKSPRTRSIAKVKKFKIKNKLITKMPNISSATTTTTNGPHSTKSIKQPQSHSEVKKALEDDPSRFMLQKIPLCENQAILKRYGCSHVSFL
uniref:Tubulin glycylase 3Alike [Bombyx mori] n=1 Tax=Lepeophtheirus salmonis TaxID=72036 RepID=A0A0K2TGN2_LEPSM